MSISNTFTYYKFDPVTAVLTVQGTSTDSSTLATINYTKNITLPVDANGQVPTGSQLSAYVDFAVRAQIAGEMVRSVALASNGGKVVNAQDIYSLTSQVETDEGAPVTVGIPITLYPDNAYRNVVTNEVTRSIVVVNVPAGTFGIDNGNIFSPAYFTNIVSAGFADVTTPVNFLEFQTPTAEQISAWPDWNTIEDGPAFDGRYYYMDHEPVQMYNYAQAEFFYS